MKRLMEIYPDWMTNPHFFNSLYTKLGWPEFEPVTLSISYFSHSGNKYASPLLENVPNEEGLADIIIHYYKHSWERYRDLTNLTYNPIENYDMNETVEENKTYGKTEAHTTDYGKTDTNTITYGKVEDNSINHGKVTEYLNGKHENITDTREYGKTDHETTTYGKNTDFNNGKTEKIVNTGTDTTTEMTYGFDSSSEVPSSKTSVTKGVGTNTTYSGIDKEINSGTDSIQRDQGGMDTFTTETINSGTDRETNTGTDTEKKTNSGKDTNETITSGKDTLNIVDGGTDKNITTTKRSGNIGVTTSQQMAQAEIELWQWNFTEQVIKDLDKILCLKIY